MGLLVVLLWLYSFYRLWMVWAYTLNFDGVSLAFDEESQTIWLLLNLLFVIWLAKASDLS